MISELDRLDKELKLAADIQANMLPMNFPALLGKLPRQEISAASRSPGFRLA